MNTMARALPAIACALLATTAAQAAGKSRAQRFAALPDWTGVWENVAWLSDASGRPPGGEAEVREKTHMVAEPPYRPQRMAIYHEARKNADQLAIKYGTIRSCKRPFPGIMEAPYTFEILTLPEQTLMVFNDGVVRHFYTDGRPHPDADNLWPTPLGDSIGRWEGDTLVVDTIARDAAYPLINRNLAATLSEQAHFTERFRRADADTLEDTMTIDDPVYFEHPWTFTIQYKRIPGDRMIEYDCDENERNPINEDGSLGLTPVS